MLRLDELLADQATQGLDAREQAELDGLLSETPGADPDVFAWSAAAAALAFGATATADTLPADLRARLERSVETIASTARGTAAPVGAPREQTAPAAAPASGAFRFPTAVPWILAAASILVAVMAWWPTSPPDLIERRATLLATAADTQTLAWTDTVDAGVSGDVVWSNAEQAGFMRFTGLPVNDPTQTQYQLWIFDKQRQVFDAVDGGVFDVDRTGTVIVEVDPKLEVFTPKLFAVTTEPPGGVVKHDPELDPDRFEIILTATPEA